jgi:MFS transporter, PPP family, 3-phenylpropionic acid transporter
MPALFFPSAFYFMFFGSLCFLMPFLALHFQGIGFSGIQIGMLTGVAPLITLIGAPLWTGLADSTRRHKVVMAFAIVVVILTALLMSRTVEFHSLFMLIVLFAFFGAPIVSLADTATMTMLGANKDRYGKIRMWGAVGWGGVALLAGIVIENFGMAWPFYGYAIGMSMTLLTALALKFPQQSSGIQFRAGMRSLFTSGHWMFFLGMVLLGGLGMATINSYLFVYMESIGISKTTMGLALTISTLSEIPVMFFASRLLRRFNPRGLLILAILVIGARLVGYAIFTQEWQILLTQLVHGFTFPIIWIAGVSYADKTAPPGLAASAQGMFGSTLMGFGAALGGLTGGLLLQRFSPSEMYLIVGLGLIAGAGLFVLAQRAGIAQSV